MSQAIIKEFCPKDQSEWRNWLEKNHQQEKAVWLVIHKKSSPNPNLTWSQAVDEALCFGWIDSVKHSLDANSYKQYFGVRKAKSTWSKINKEKVATLIRTKKMTNTGLKAIEIAKKNGSWTILDSVEKLEIPEDLKSAFNAAEGAEAFYAELSNSIKKSLLYWVISAKREDTRSKRIHEIVSCARAQKLPSNFR